MDDERRKGIGVAFGADPEMLWYASRMGDWSYNVRLPLYQLWTFDRTTGVRTERSSRFGSAMRPTLSPDGHWLVYASRYEAATGLVRRDLHTGDETWLAWPVQHDDQESAATMDVMPGMSFTPDSRYLVASYGGGMWKIPIDGGAAERIPFRVRFDLLVGPKLDFESAVPDDTLFHAAQIRHPSPSPDGERLAFTALDRLWVANADGTEPRRITRGDASEHYPVWSPDGGWIAFVTWSRDGGHIWKVRPDGDDAQQLTQNAALYAQPAWSPDGERIVALRGSAREFRRASNPFSARSGIDDIVWIPADGGAAHIVAAADGRTTPHFRRDQPGRIYFHSNASGLVSMRWDGTDERTHVDVSAGSGLNDVTLVSPDGTHALASRNDQLYVVAIPNLAAEAATISVSNPANAAFPAIRLTDGLGGEFPTWSADGTQVHWSLGNVHFTYDVAAALSGDSVAPVATPVLVPARRDRPRGTIVLRGARVITMRGDEVIENADVVVRDNRIVAVGATGRVAVPDDARVMDVRGKTIVPGFVDVHSHMAPVWGVHRRDQWTLAVNLAYGVTATRDPQTTLTDVLTYGDLVETGDILGPRIFSTGPGIDHDAGIRTLDDARTVLRRYKEYYGTNTVKQYTAGNRKQRQLIVMAARELGLMPTTEASLDFRLELTQDLDGYPGHEHNWIAHPLYGDIIDLMVATGVTYTPTLQVAYGGPPATTWFYQTEDVHDDAKLRRFTPHDEIDSATRRRSQWTLPDEQVFTDHARFAARLVEAGGRVGVGSHGQTQGLGFHWEMWALASGGMTPHDVLRAATLHGADAIGYANDLGSIEPGKLADLVILDANPLDDIRNTNTIHYVMKNGRLYSGNTLAQVYPDEAAGPSWWWWDDAPTAELPGIETFLRAVRQK
ncbi:MAG: amidohydrolase family protein [Longimicrobiales bacterium]